MSETNSSSTTTTTTNTVIAVMSVLAGIWAFANLIPETQNEHFKPIGDACKDSTIFETSNLHPYDTRIGFVVFDFMVCFITQFMYDLVTITPMGLMMWGTTIISAIPAMILITLESNRYQNRGILKWPVTISFLGQVFGISVVFPLLWVPSYIFFANKDGTVNPTLAKIVVGFALPFVTLTIAVFTLDVQTDIWTTCAGTLGGPLICIFSAIPYFFKAPETCTSQQKKEISRKCAVSYGIGGLIATCAWYYMLFLAYSTFGTDYQTLLRAIWTQAHPSIKFMTIDALVLWVGLVLHIASRRTNSALEAIMLTPFYGPGGACCMSLASLELGVLPKETKEEKKD